MKSTSRTNGGLILLYHILTLPTDVSSFASSRSAFVARSPSINQGINSRQEQQEQHKQRHVLFSSSTTNGNNNNRVVPKALGTSGNWSAYLDESKGLIYYFNPTTGESKWEAPHDADFSTIEMEIDGAKKAEMRERLKTYLEERLKNSTTKNPSPTSSSSSSSSSNDIIGAMQNDRRTMEYKRREATENLRMKQSMISSSKSKPSTSTTRTSTSTRSTSSTNNRETLSPANNLLAEHGPYQALIDTTRGRIYYHNKNTRESTWERPAGFPEFKVSASKRVAMEAQFQRYVEWHDGSGVGVGAERDGEERVERDGGGGGGGDVRDATRAKVNVLGRGVVSVSDFSYEDGLEVEEETAAAVVADSSGDAAKVEEEPTANTVIPETNENKRPNSLPIVQQGDWSAYFDVKTGVVFYFDETTGTTSWDPPFKDFPRIVMEGSVPKVLDSSSIGNISMERALGYIGVDEMAEALKWEEAKEEERRKNAAKKAAAAAAAAEETAVVEIENEESPAAVSTEPEGKTVEMYEAVKNAELERLEQEKIMAEEKKIREEEAAAAATAAQLAQEENARLEKERIAAQYAAAKEREVAAKLAIQEKLEQELLEKERLENERAEKERLEAEAAAAKLAMQEKFDQELLEKERLESERVEKERLEAEAAAAKLAIQENLEQELLEKGRLESERVEKERLEAEAAAKLAIQKKLDQELLETERLESERVEKEKREAAAKLAIQEKLDQELLEKERLESERAEKERLEAEEKTMFQAKEVVTQPVLPKEDPTITAETVKTMVAPLKTRTLYDILQCSTTASRSDLKRSYLSLAKQSHPDALLQMGKSQNDETERRFVEISQAWKILGDSTSRRRYDRELRAKGISSKAGNMFEGWVMGAAKVMDEALAKAENDLENGGEMRP